MNMSYCRFQNTLIDLHDCLRALEEIDFNISELSEDEAKAACRLIEICKVIGGQDDNR